MFLNRLPNVIFCFSKTFSKLSLHMNIITKETVVTCSLLACHGCIGRFNGNHISLSVQMRTVIIFTGI